MTSSHTHTSLTPGLHDVIHFCDDLYSSIISTTPRTKSNSSRTRVFNNRATISSKNINTKNVKNTTNNVVSSLETRNTILQQDMLAKDTFTDVISKHFTIYCREEHRHRRRLGRYRDYLMNDLELLSNIVIALHLELNDECYIVDDLLNRQYSDRNSKEYYLICIEQLKLPDYGFAVKSNYSNYSNYSNNSNNSGLYSNNTTNSNSNGKAKGKAHSYKGNIKANSNTVTATSTSITINVKDYCCSACLEGRYMRLTAEQTKDNANTHINIHSNANNNDNNSNINSNNANTSTYLCEKYTIHSKCSDELEIDIKKCLKQFNTDNQVCFNYASIKVYHYKYYRYTWCMCIYIERESIPFDLCLCIYVYVFICGNMRHYLCVSCSYRLCSQYID